MTSTPVAVSNDRMLRPSAGPFGAQHLHPSVSQRYLVTQLQQAFQPQR